MPVQQVPNSDLGPDTARLNLLTNPGFEIWQRGNGPTTFGFSADAWQLYNASTPYPTFEKDTTQMLSGGACMLARVAAGSGVLQQKIENWNSFRGKPLAVSIAVKSSTGGVTLGLDDGVANGTPSSPTTGTGNYEILRATITCSPSMTRLWVMVGFPAPAASTIFYLDAATLVPGLQTADYVPLHPADDLLRCQRIFENSIVPGPDSHVATGFSYSSANAILWWPFRVRKSANPTVTVATPAGFMVYTGAAAGVAVTAISPDSLSPGSCRLNTTVASGLTTGQGSMLFHSGVSSISAECNPA